VNVDPSFRVPTYGSPVEAPDVAAVDGAGVAAAWLAGFDAAGELQATTSKDAAVRSANAPRDPVRICLSSVRNGRPAIAENRPRGGQYRFQSVAMSTFLERIAFLNDDTLATALTVDSADHPRHHITRPPV
jgi:hypothetical protein